MLVRVLLVLVLTNSLRTDFTFLSSSLQLHVQSLVLFLAMKASPRPCASKWVLVNRLFT